MSMGPSSDLRELLSALCDEAATLQQMERLEELLRHSPEAQWTYLCYMDMHARLMQHPGLLPTLAGAGEPSSSVAPGEVGQTGRVHCDEAGAAPSQPARKRFSGNPKLLALVLLVGVALSALAAFWSRHGPPLWENLDHVQGGQAQDDIVARNPPPAPGSPHPGPALPAPRDAASTQVAVLAGACNARWGAPVRKLDIGAALHSGERIHIEAGIASLEFPVGATLILQAPAQVRLVSNKRIELDRGKITAKIAREEARGFEIVTPEADFVDQGTEFGVEVAPGGRSKLHVFQGQVDVDLKAREGRPAPLSQRLEANAGARMETGEAGMVLVEETGECFVRSMDEAHRDQHVVAYWRFEDRPVGILLPDTAANHRPACATVDSSFNGNDLYVAMARNRPTFSADVCTVSVSQTGSPNRSCLDTSKSTAEIHRLNVYTHSEFSHSAPLDVQRITPAQWTIEASVKTAKLFGRSQGFLGRDATFTLDAGNSRAPARLTFQINARDRFSIQFYDADGRFHEAVAEDLPVEAGRWYHLAATSDGRVLRLYVDALDGHGYVPRAATELPTTGSTALGKGQDNAEWTLGRAGNAGDPADWLRFWGWIDEVRISDVAREPAEFLFAPKG